VRDAAALMVAAVVMAAAPAAGQTPARPGPWVLDLRGVTSGIPTDTTFYPTLTSTIVPSRGFGADVGGHVYLSNLGPARVGLGASVMNVRATATAAASTDAESAEPGQRVTLTLRAIAPQVSFNFGARDGWSYLSAGLGLGSVNSRTENDSPGEHESGRLRTVNYGGGARWFVTPRLAFGVDLRAYRLAAGAGTPRVSIFAAGAGLSIR
jgi:outer membrane protein with beta-barrel domain